MIKLIITAHPSTQGFTHQIADRLSALSKSEGHTVELLDLYKTDLRQDYLRYEDRRELGKDPTTHAFQTKIALADELIFIAPMWWGDVPAIMKNFIDCNFTSGFAFKYIDGKPVGLLKGKSVRVILTSGAPSFLYKLILHIQWMWKFNRVNFCGMDQKSFTVFGDMDSSKTDKSKYLKEIEKLI